MNITYLILTHNEPQVARLLEHVFKHINEEDNVIVLDDYSDNASVFNAYLDYPNFTLVQHELKHSYSEHRNYALPYCLGDYIFAIDADEFPTEYLLKNLKTIIAESEADLYWVPRANIFKGITPVDVIKYGWNYSGGLVNWPDYQSRLFKNHIGLEWKGSLHERIKVQPEQKQLMIAEHPTLCLIHTKTIEQQRASNDNYNRKYSVNENKGVNNE